jgi:hypothetical protein
MLQGDDMDERYDWELSETVLGSGRGVSVMKRASRSALGSVAGAMALMAQIMWAALEHGGDARRE